MTFTPAIVNGLAPLERVAIPAGTFQMGSTRFVKAQPVTDVTVSAFEISKTRVTVGQYDAYLGAIGKNRITLGIDPTVGIVSILGRGRTESEAMEVYLKSSLPKARMSCGGLIELSGITIFEVATPDIPKDFREFSDQPMVMVNWWEMAAFAAAHGGRLPTEAQYERVMRGRSGKNEFGTLTGELTTKDGTKLAHYGASQTARVGSYPADSWGREPASGNTWVWTDSWYADSYAELWTKDPRGPKHGNYRVLRGGSYYNDGDVLRAAYRIHIHTMDRNNVIGGVVAWRSQDSR